MNIIWDYHICIGMSFSFPELPPSASAAVSTIGAADDYPRLLSHWQLQENNEYQCLRSADPVFAPIRSSTSSSFRDVDGELCLMNILLALLPSKLPVPVHQDRSYARDSCYQWHLVWQSDTHYMNQRLVTYPFMLETVCADGWCWYVLQKCNHCHSWWRFQAIPKGLFEYSHV